MSDNDESDLVPIKITDDEKSLMISQYVKENLMDVSQQIFNDYIRDNTNQLDSPMQKWTIAEAALGAAVVNEMVNKLLQELIDRENPKCEHDKLFSLSYLASNPPQYKWVCRNCGEQGRTFEPHEGSSEYDAIVNRYHSYER